MLGLVIIADAAGYFPGHPLLPAGDAGAGDQVDHGSAVFMIEQPAGMLRGAWREVVGRAVDPETTGEVRVRIDEVIDELPCELLEVAVTKLGRVHFVVSYIKPSGAVVAEDLDTLRMELHESYANLFPLVRSEIVYSAEPPYE